MRIEISLFVILSLLSNTFYFFFVAEVHCVKAQRICLFGNVDNQESVSASVLLAKYNCTTSGDGSLCVDTTSMGLLGMNTSCPDEQKINQKKVVPYHCQQRQSPCLSEVKDPHFAERRCCTRYFP